MSRPFQEHSVILGQGFTVGFPDQSRKLGNLCLFLKNQLDGSSSTISSTTSSMTERARFQERISFKNVSHSKCDSFSRTCLFLKCDSFLNVTRSQRTCLVLKCYSFSRTCLVLKCYSFSRTCLVLKCDSFSKNVSHS